MKSVIIDTSSILFGISKKVDVFRKIDYLFPGARIILPSGVVRELRGLKLSKGKNSRHAAYALTIIEGKGIRATESWGKVDDWITNNAQPNRQVVCTNDIGLKRRLRAKGVRVVSLSVGGSLR